MAVVVALGAALTGLVTAGAGATPVELQIYNGERASIVDLPAVVLLDTGSSACTGTVVAPRWVLTAAHCVTGVHPDTMRVAIGSDSLAAGFPELRRVDRAVAHPDFARGRSGDIALLELDAASAAPPILLAAAGAPDPVGTRATIAGWGGLVTQPVPEQTEHLMRADIPVLPDSACGFYGSDFDPATKLCAGGEGRDVCAGDSGGPLVVDGVQYGVAAFGEPCGAQSSTIGAYTAVAAYRPWIEDVTGGLSTVGGSPEPRPDPVLEPAPDAAEAAVQFSDVRSSDTHGENILLVAAERLAGGYPDDTFRPDAPVTREQMATFLSRGLDLPDPGGQLPFSDVDDGNAHLAGIRAVRAAGITGGYPDGTFRPGAPVTRGQMATFLRGALGLPDPGLALFPDVPPDSTHGPGIQAVAAAGIAGGRSDGTYGPAAAVTRAQMATFLARAFLDAPLAQPPEPLTPPAPPTDPLGELTVLCSEGDMDACDELYLRAPEGSEAERLGDTCGDRQPADTGYWCVDTFASATALRCADGDMRACDELFRRSNPESLEELVGDSCGFRQPLGTGRWCVDAFGPRA